jgi:hypothetical protein
MDFEKRNNLQKGKKKRFISALILVLAVISGIYIGEYQASKTLLDPPPQTSGSPVEATNDEVQRIKTAQAGLDTLAIKGRAPKTGYTRARFGSGWEKSGGCDTRNRILARDLTDILYEVNSCVVLSGKLNDPYTAKEIQFTRGSGTSTAIQIDHVVALSDAWQKGAQLLTPTLREKLANDGLNLLAVDGPANQQKSDGDAATWLPPNKSARCAYVARQIAVKVKYSLWITSAEKDAMQKVLQVCPQQSLPS